MNTMKRPFVTGILLASVLFPPASARTTKPAGEGKAQLVAEFARLIRMDTILIDSAHRQNLPKLPASKWNLRWNSMMSSCRRPGRRQHPRKSHPRRRVVQCVGA